MTICESFYKILTLECNKIAWEQKTESVKYFNDITSN